jgi:hypothetical protein
LFRDLFFRRVTHVIFVVFGSHINESLNLRERGSFISNGYIHPSVGISTLFSEVEIGEDFLFVPRFYSIYHTVANTIQLAVLRLGSNQSHHTSRLFWGASVVSRALPESSFPSRDKSTVSGCVTEGGLPDQRAVTEDPDVTVDGIASDVENDLRMGVRRGQRGGHGRSREKQT